MPLNFLKNFLQEAGSLPEAVRLYVQQVEQNCSLKNNTHLTDLSFKFIKIV